MLQDMLLFSAVIGLIAVLANIIGVSLYDLAEAKKQRQMSTRTSVRSYRRRPLISLIIPTHDSQDSIIGCLQSIVSSSYRKFEILVVDADSRDATKRLVRQFSAAQPKQSVRLIAGRNRAGGQAVVLRAFKRYAGGELVMQLDPTMRLDKGTLKSAVATFNHETDLSLLSPKFKTTSNTTLPGLLSAFEQLLRYRSQKSSHIAGSPVPVRLSGNIVTRTIFIATLAAAGSQLQPAYFATSVLVWYQPPSFADLFKQPFELQLRAVQSLKRRAKLTLGQRADRQGLSALVRVASALGIAFAVMCLPILLSYFIYLALKLHQPVLYNLSWTLIGLLLAFSIWSDEQMKVSQKILFILLIPVNQVYFFILSFVRSVAVLAGLAAPQKLFHRS